MGRGDVSCGCGLINVSWRPHRGRSIAQYFPFKQICPFLTAMKSVLSVYSSIFFFLFFFPPTIDVTKPLYRNPDIALDP